MIRPARNIELKARLPALDAARQVALRLATARLGVMRQIDTYFSIPHGRLKLREIDEPPRAELIWYDRADAVDFKSSDYRITPVEHPQELKATLQAALGLPLVVDKRREVFLYQNVRIHLDEVAGLGSFIEFEAVLGDGNDGQIDDARGFAQLAWLRDQFSIRAEQLIASSYCDLLCGMVKRPSHSKDLSLIT